MTYPYIDPVIIQIGRLQVRWYGLMYIIGFVLAYIIFRRNAKTGRIDLTGDEIGDLLTYCIGGVVIGGRLGYCIIYDFLYYASNPLKLFALWEGGMSFHGGMMGVILAGWVFAKVKNRSFLSLADMGALAAPIGLFFGRIGNFINGELYGRIAPVSWGVVFPGGGKLPRHPSQLYEAFFEGLVLFIILQILNYRKVPRGIILGTFLLGYGFFRFFIEFFREPDPQIGFVVDPFTMGQILCVIMMACGIFVYWWRWKLEKRVRYNRSASGETKS